MVHELKIVVSLLELPLPGEVCSIRTGLAPTQSHVRVSLAPIVVATPFKAPANESLIEAGALHPPGAVSACGSCPETIKH